MGIANDIEELVRLQRETLARLCAGPAELLDIDAAAALVAVSPNTLWAMASGSDFPSPVDIGIKKTLWRRTEILDWIKRRKPKRKPKRATIR